MSVVQCVVNVCLWARDGPKVGLMHDILGVYHSLAIVRVCFIFLKQLSGV